MSELFAFRIYPDSAEKLEKLARSINRSKGWVLRTLILEAVEPKPAKTEFFRPIGNDGVEQRERSND